MRLRREYPGAGPGAAAARSQAPELGRPRQQRFQGSHGTAYSKTAAADVFRAAVGDRRITDLRRLGAADFLSPARAALPAAPRRQQAGVKLAAGRTRRPPAQA